MLFSKYTFTVFSVFCLLYLSISEGRASLLSTPTLHDIIHSQDVFYVIQRLFSVSQSGCSWYTISTTSDSCQRNGEREWVLFGCVCKSGSLGEHQMSDDRKPSQVITKGNESLSDWKDDKGGDEDDKNLRKSFLDTVIFLCVWACVCVVNSLTLTLYQAHI